MARRKHDARFIFDFAGNLLFGGSGEGSSDRLFAHHNGVGHTGRIVFTNAVVTVTFTGDTAGVTAGPAPFTRDLINNAGTATVSVAGLGTATFTGSVEIISTLNDLSLFGAPAVLIAQLDNATGTSVTGILLQTGSVFSSYDLRGPAGPVSGSGGVASGSSMTPVFPTTAGNFTWAIGQPLGTSTFTAVTQSVPAISSGGVVPINSTVTTIQPGEWASIYGSNLASGTTIWNGDFPTSLGGTSVTINGKAAYLWYVRPVAPELTPGPGRFRNRLCSGDSQSRRWNLDGHRHSESVWPFVQPARQ